MPWFYGYEDAMPELVDGPDLEDAELAALIEDEYFDGHPEPLDFDDYYIFNP